MSERGMQALPLAAMFAVWFACVVFKKNTVTTNKQQRTTCTKWTCKLVEMFNSLAFCGDSVFVLVALFIFDVFLLVLTLVLPKLNCISHMVHKHIHNKFTMHPPQSCPHVLDLHVRRLVFFRHVVNISFCQAGPCWVGGSVGRVSSVFQRTCFFM